MSDRSAAAPSCELAVVVVNWNGRQLLPACLATLAALDGLASPTGKRLILIAGGDGKGADFSPLRLVSVMANE